MAWFFIRRYVERAELTATTCSQVVNRPRPVPGADLVRDLDQRLLAGVLGVAGVGQDAPAHGERARAHGAQQVLQGVAVASLGAPRQVVDLVRGRRRLGHHAPHPPQRDRT